MRLLALETAAARPRVALLEDGAVRVAPAVADPEGPAETLLPAIDAALREAGWRLEDLDGLAISIGPGSFTGLRVGVATVKGLAFRRPLPVAPVPTLGALAWGEPAQAAGREPRPWRVACLDARRGELYGAAWEPVGDDLVRRVPEGVWHPEALADALLGGSGPWILRGDGAALLRPPLEARSGGRVQVAGDGPPTAEAVGVLGTRMLARGEGVSAAALVPRYLRRAEAEVRRIGEPVEPGVEAAFPSGQIL